MNTSLASELSQRLSHELDQYAASLSVSQLGGTESPSLETSENDDEARPSEAASSDEAVIRLSSALAKIRHQHGNLSGLSLKAVKSQAEAASSIQARISKGDVRSAAAGNRAQAEQADQLQWILNSHIAIATWGAVFTSLMDQAEKVKEEEAYWQSVEGEDASGAMYLIQTFPVRAANALRVLFERLKVIASSPRPPKSLFSVRVVKRALPPSLLITSLFPHLSASLDDAGNASTSTSPNKQSSRSLLFLTFSPLLLTRQEVSQKRKKLEGLRLDLAKRIGAFVKDADAAVSRLKETRERPGIAFLGEVIGERITFLEQSLADPLPLGQKMRHYEACDLRSATEMLTSVEMTLYKSSKRNAATFRRQLAPLRKPLWITRSWPWLVATPLVGYYGGKILYNSRQSLYEYYQLAVDTVRGFVVDWVVDPCMKILETLRHGDSSLALMGRESLKSDFDVSTSASSNMTSQKVFIEAMRANLRLALYFQSLERMVADFAKDMKLSPEQIAAVANRLREGDMSLVLGAYEEDLKSPLKSAVTGTLVRSLLIQIQKVKVDVDIAMDGIEKMLRSQQLTFAFVGVAPSMLLLYLTSSWLRNFFRTGPSSNSKASRKRVWYTMRSIDRILTASLDSTANPKVLNDVSTGLLLIELTTLRRYVASPAFPTRDRGIKTAFLDDIRGLEKGGIGLDAKIRVFDRMNRTFGQYLKA